MKKTVILSIFIFLNAMLGCVKETCPPTEAYLNIQSISCQSMRLGPDQTWLTSVDSSDTVDVDQLVMRIHLRGDYYAEMKQRPNLWGGELYAFNCPVPGYRGSKEGVAHIDVITLEDFNAEYSAMDTLSEVVIFGNAERLVDFETFVGKSEYIERHRDSIPFETIDFKVTTDLGADFQTARFKFVLELTDGRSFETVSDALTLVD